MSDHLKFNTGFLEKDNREPQVVNSNKISKKESTGDKKGLNWVVVVVVSIFAILIVSIIFDNNSTSTTSSPSAVIRTKPIQTQTRVNTPPGNNSNINNNEEYMILGEYRCYMTHYNKAISLKPNENEGSALDLRSSELDRRFNSLDRLSAEIKNTAVNEYSEWSVDNYNSKINSYNTKHSSYQIDANKFDNDIDNYNRRVDTYNDYLDNNCTKIK